jgi:hypothetical protein
VSQRFSGERDSTRASKILCRTRDGLRQPRRLAIQISQEPGRSAHQHGPEILREPAAGTQLEDAVNAAGEVGQQR